MELKSFDTILTQMCDEFDNLISPKKIARTNTNIIFLMFKAISKGLELINNICVVLSNKFNPAKCSEEDLVSVASLVGTERRAGSASGLRITVTNTSSDTASIIAGIYTYNLDDDTQFEFTVLETTNIQANTSISYIAMSTKIGRFHVTEQPDIEVKSEQTISSSLVFSCTDNTALLGNETETLLAFRKRILNTYDRQNSMVELEEYIRNLPYIFDCKIKYNQTAYDITVDNIVIPPMHCAIFYSGEVKNDIAEMVADHIICPTVSTNDSVEVRYENSVFADGYYAVNLIPFAKQEYEVDIHYKIDNEYVNAQTAKAQIEKALYSAFIAEKHVDYVTEDDVYTVLESLNIAGLSILAVNLVVDGNTVDYVTVPVSRIPELVDIHFQEG